MNKKMFVGNLGIVVILILVSFSSVVGVYEQTESLSEETGNSFLSGGIDYLFPDMERKMEIGDIAYPYPYHYNLVRNPSFEKLTDSDNVFENWTVEKCLDPDNITADHNVSYSGEYSCKMEKHSTEKFCVLSQTIQCLPNMNYCFGACIKTNGLDGEGAYLVVQNKSVNNNQWKYRFGWTRWSQEWKYASQKFKTKENDFNLTIKVAVHNSSTYGVAWFDNVYLLEDPVNISEVHVRKIDNTKVEVRWKTEKSSTSQVQYGETSSYGNWSYASKAMVVNHSIIISGLVEGKRYHYRVFSLGVKNNLSISRDYTFTLYNIPSDHPRVFFTGADLGDLYNRTRHPLLRWKCENLTAFAYNQMGELSQDMGTWIHRYYILLYSFLYRIGLDGNESDGNESYGAEAQRLMVNLLNKSSESFSVFDWTYFADALAIGYDWCFDIVAQDENLKIRIEDRMIEAAEYLKNTDLRAYANHGPWYYGAIAYVGIALGFLDYLDIAAYSFKEQILPATEEVGGDGEWHEGLSYTMWGTVPRVTEFCELWRVATGENLFTGGNLSDFNSTHPDVRDGSDFLKHIAKFVIYYTTPDRMLMRTGDTSYCSLHPGGTGSVFYMGFYFHLLAARYKEVDPVAAEHAQYYADNYCFVGDNYPDFISIWKYSGFYWTYSLLWQDLNPSPSTHPSPLPLTRHFKNIGNVVMRTSWDKNATIVRFECGDYFTGHSHYDQNSFIIYKKGNLAIDSGYYGSPYGNDHQMNYSQRTIAHNSITVYDPDEEFIYGPTSLANDGGQLVKISEGRTACILGDPEDEFYETGDIVLVEDQENVYSYVKGDAIAAYNSSKLSLFTRELVLLHPKEEQDTRDFVVIFDRINVTNPSFKKTWLLHSVQEPEIAENDLVIINRNETVNLTYYQPFWYYPDPHNLPEPVNETYAGQLFCKTLLPSLVGSQGGTITKIGGNGFKFWVDGENYNYAEYINRHCSPEHDIGSWRIEVSPHHEPSPGGSSSEDFFLHVLYPCSLSEETFMPSTTLLESDHESGSMKGAFIKSDVNRVALFRNSDAIPSYVHYSIDADNPSRHILFGLQPGRFYQIRGIDGDVLPGRPFFPRIVQSSANGTLMFDSDQIGSLQVKVIFLPGFGMKQMLEKDPGSMYIQKSISVRIQNLPPWTTQRTLEIFNLGITPLEMFSIADWW